MEDNLVIIDSVTKQVRNEFSFLSTEQINWKINPESWSIAECIDHITVTNEAYFQKLKAIVDRTHKNPGISLISIYTKFCGNLILNAVNPKTKRKSKTFPVFMPAMSNYDHSVFDRFDTTQVVLRTYFEKLNKSDYHSISITSPASNLIVLPLSYVFKILTLHEQRHVNQAINIKRQKGFLN